MWLVGIGGVVLLLALLVWYEERIQRQQKRDILFTNTPSIKTLLDTHQAVTTSVGGEILSQRCEVQGRIEADEPLEGPVSKQPVVAYRFVLERKQDDGSYQQTREETKHARFFVRDESGRILVDTPQADEVDLPAAEQQYIGEYLRGEESLKVGQPVYVLGWLGDFHGEPVITTNADSITGGFIITWKSEGQVLRETKSMISSNRVAWVALLVVGLGLVAAGVLFW